jgi:hypothetical protein
VYLHFLWITPLVLLIVYLSSPRFRGEIAETRVRRLLASGLEKSRYTVLNNVDIPFSGGSLHLDHIVVSRFGLFVIESEYVRGKVSGGEFQERWKASRFGRSTRFDNPVHRNAVQVQALQKLLKMPASKFHPITVLVGHSSAENSMPVSVVPAENLVAWIRKNNRQIIEGEQADELIRTIGEVRFQPAGRLHFDQWSLLRYFLLLVLLGGIYLVARDDLAVLYGNFAQQSEQAGSPENFRPDGSRKSEQELYEDSLICAYSPDTNRCTCLEPDGPIVEVGFSKCRSLAERGSVLSQ